MGFIQCSFYSKTLGFTTNMNICLPQDITHSNGGYSVPEGGYTTLYLLHGLGDDHTIWSRKCAIDRFAATHNIAIVMPEAGRSFYTDMAYGYPYYTFISEELPKLCESFFPLTKDPSRRFIGGLSMGGYGAMKIGLSHPDQYRGIISLSGVLDILQIASLRPDLEKELLMIFGDQKNLHNSPHNIFTLSEEMHTQVVKPHLYVACGTEDFLYDHSAKFKYHAESLNYDLTYRESPGAHDFYYWENEIQHAMTWINNLI